jgi:hypothetical protein
VLLVVARCKATFAYTILDHAANLLAALGDDLTTRLERDLEDAAR